MKPLNVLVVIGAIGMLGGFSALAQQSAPSTTATQPESTNTITVCPYQDIMLQPGMRSDEVKTLQSILAQDPTIYPQGITSGYYGTLTQEAMKRLQRKMGLPETGMLDEHTRPIIFPCTKIRVTNPNGGETWRVGETYDITWEIEAPYILRDRMMNQMREEVLPEGQAAPQTNSVMPFFQNLSIDLIRYDQPQIMIYPAPVYYHIGSASLYGDHRLTWTIPSDIADSKMYKVRITLWRNIPRPFDCKDSTRPCPLVPGPRTYPIRWQGSIWDESDDYFAITGGPTASPLPTPPPLDRGTLQAIRSQLLQALESIQKAIEALDALLK